LALIALIGLTGSTIPQVYTNQSTSQSTLLIGFSVKTPSGPSAVAPQIAARLVSSAQPEYNASEVGFRQIQQLIQKGSEGILYEDYRSRRSRLLICIELAKRLSGGSLSLTQIALLARINFGQAKALLELMSDAGLTSVDDSLKVKTYSLTRRGLLFLKHGEMTLKLLQPVARQEEIIGHQLEEPDIS
jgi:predicted transcriptional regulator